MSTSPTGLLGGLPLRSTGQPPPRVEVAATDAEVDGWRAWWSTLPITDPDADPDYFMAVVHADDSVRRPHVLRIEEPGLPPILVVARLVDQRFGLRGGPRGRGPGLRARTLVVAFDGILGADGPQARAAVLRALRRQLADGVADVVLLQKLDRTGPLAGEVTDAVPAPLRMQRQSMAHWSARLPESWEALLAARSSKSRRQLRYDDSKLRRRYDGRLQLRRLDLPEHADRLYPDLRAVAGVSYQAGLGVSLVDGPVDRALTELARERGWLRVWMLYVDDEPVAFWWGITVRGRLSVRSPGFRPELARDRVGYFTLRRMLEDCCADPAVDVVDFGPGHADYKERFGTDRAEVADVLLFARRPRAIAVHGVLGVREHGVRLARAAVERAGRADALRRWWRERNRARHSTPGAGAGG